MLKAKYRELISAYLDGELTPAEREEAVRLLLENPEAAQLHAALLAQRSAVRRSAVRPAPVDLRPAVFRKLNPMRPAPAKSSPRRVAFLACLAASLFAIVGLASFNIFFKQSGNPIANRTKPAATSVTPRGELPPADDAEPDTVVTVNSPAAKPNNPPSIELLPAPRPAGDTDGVLAVPSGPEFELNRTVPPGRLSLLMALKDLNQETSAAKLKAELAKDEVVRIDLFCRDIGKSHEHLVAALKSKGLSGHLDGTLPERFKRRAVGEVIYFTESLTQAEMAALLQQLARDDAAKPADAAQFDSLVLLPHQTADIDRLCRSMGVPMAQLKLNRKPTAVDSKTSLEANTGSKVAQAIRAGGKGVNQFLAVPYFAGDKGAVPLSREAKAFLEQRGDSKANSRPLILILRQL